MRRVPHQLIYVFAQVYTIKLFLPIFAQDTMVLFYSKASVRET